jgi:hypothetical protein
MDSKDQDLSAFFADRARQYRDYVAGCIQLTEKTVRACQPHLGQGAKLAIQALKPSQDQTQISPNGVLQENGVAVFAYTIDFAAPEMPTYAANFFLSVGKLGADKGSVEEWFVGHDGQSFPLPDGGEGPELEPLFAHIVKMLQDSVVATYPIEVARDASHDKPDAPKPDAPKPDAPKADAPKPEAPKPEVPKAEAPKPEAPKPETPKAKEPA